MVKTLYTQLVMILTFVSVVTLAASPETTSLAAVGVGLALVTAMFILRGSTGIASVLTLTIGSRSRRHREAVPHQVAPSHPNTAGRPRGRAPTRLDATT